MKDNYKINKQVTTKWQDKWERWKTSSTMWTEVSKEGLKKNSSSGDTSV